MDHSLSSYIRQAALAGRLQSTGCFTVNLEKKLVRLRESRFHQAYHYLLTCVRAGVTADADRIEIKSTPNLTQITFLNAKSISSETLLEATLGGSDAITESLLGAAIQGGLGGGANRVQLVLPDAHLEISAKEIKHQPAENSDKVWALAFHFAGPKKVAKNRCKEETQAVLGRGSFCPIPLFLNGISVVDNPGWESLFHWQSDPLAYGLNKDFVWLEGFLSDTTGDGFFFTAPRRSSKVEYLGRRRYQTAQWQPHSQSSFLRISPPSKNGRVKLHSLTRLGTVLEGPSYLYLIKQGVVLDAVEENLGAPGVGVVVRGDDFETDISLYRPIKTEHYEELLNQIRAHTGALLSKLAQERKNFVLNAPDRATEALWKGGLCSLGGILMGLPMGFTGSLVLGATLFLAAGAFCFSDRQDRSLVKREQGVRWELDSFLGCVDLPSQDRLRL